MCTVSYIPLGNREFFLTSNRDEALARGLALAPEIIKSQHGDIMAPLDPLAKGSWIAAADSGDVVCLLNGAFVKHQHQPPYRMSRGKVVMDYFNRPEPMTFGHEYPLHGIEPFTLLMIHPQQEIELYELRWDGRQRFFKKADPAKFHLWSSCTLYAPELEEMKKQAFANGLQMMPLINTETVVRLHLQFLYQDWVQSPLRVPQVSTLSVTTVHHDDFRLSMTYLDLTQQPFSQQFISLQKTHPKATDNFKE